MNEPPMFTEWFIVYIIACVSIAVTLLLVLVLIIEMKMNRVLRRLDDISSSATQFVKMGVSFFKDR